MAGDGIRQANGEALLGVSGLGVNFRTEKGKSAAVQEVSFEIARGETLALVGESGSGKSVSALSILQLLPYPAATHTRGSSIVFKGQELMGAPARALRKVRGDEISMIFQEPMTSLNPLHSVEKQVNETLILHKGLTQEQARLRTLELLHMVGIKEPERRLSAYPHELSGGQRQRVMIAMALANEPDLLIADEPTTALDVTIQAQILKLLRDLQEELGMAVLMITHDLGVVANVAEEVVVMYHGEVMESGNLQSIFDRPQHPYLKALLRAVPRFDMEPGERLQPIREIAHEGSSRLLAAREPWPASADEAGPLLSVKAISKSFRIRKSGMFGGSEAGSVLAVDDVSFAIRRGECLGLVGESGCGKTTLSKIIMRALTPDEGEIVFNDRGSPTDVLGLKGDDLIRFRQRIQFMFQDPFSSLNPRMTVQDIISEPLLIHNIGNAASRAEMVKELMRLVGLDIRHLKRYPHSFSGGQRQRIGIARALALKPDLLICDEPVSALDVSIQAQILNLLKDLRDELGLTYMFISHNLAVVDYIADRIAVMCRARLVELAPRDVLFREPVHPYTQALISAVPEPDPTRRLDLSALMEGRASDPAAWPAPFTVDGHTHPQLVDLGDGHYVRADPALGALRAAQ